MIFCVKLSVMTPMMKKENGQKMADSDPRLAPHNVESAGFKGGSVKGQYDVSAQARKKAAANSNSGQSPLAAG